MEQLKGKKNLEYTNLILSIILAALATPIVKWLITNGGKVGISNPNAISFCNILFVGNICSGLVAVATFGWGNIWRHLKELNSKTTLLLMSNLVIGTVIAPIFLYTALETTTVTNLVLLTRIEAVVYSILGVLFFDDRISKMNWIGLVIIVVGTMILFLVQGGGSLMTGDGLGVLAGILYAFGSSLGRTLLKYMGISAFIFSRNLIGAIVFFWLAIILYGTDHFADAFSANLWLVMTVYAALIVVLGQTTWFRAVATFPSGTISAWSTLTPVLGILFAFLLLHEIPETSQWIAAAIILSGLAISQIGPWSSAASQSMVEKGLSGA